MFVEEVRHAGVKGYVPFVTFLFLVLFSLPFPVTATHLEVVGRRALR